MRILILSGNFGMGHNSAAQAILEEISAQHPGAEICIVDLLEYIIPATGKNIYSLFNFVADKCHGVYNTISKLSNYLNIELSPPNQIYAKIQLLLETTAPDLIICTLPLCVRMLAAYKKKTAMAIPIAVCITDIGIHKDWFAPNIDLYFAPVNQTKTDLIQQGVAAEKIYVTGIPVRKEFKNLTPKNPANKQKNILIMGGGLGMLPNMDILMADLVQYANLQVTVICGSNLKAYNELLGKYTNLEVVGFTHQVSQYMQQADLLISKAGGITLFEAIYAQTPLIVINPFLEQEIANAAFIEKRGIGKIFWHPTDNYLAQINAFLTNHQEQEQLQKQLRQVKAEISAYSISDILTAYCQEKAA